MKNIEWLIELSKIKAKPIPKEYPKGIRDKFIKVTDPTFPTFEEFPEEAAVVDAEWLVNFEGAITFTKDFTTTRKRPWLICFIGLSGHQYYWLSSDIKEYCSIGNVFKLGVCHNLAAERQLFKECLNPNGNLSPCWFDTMATHLVLAGVGGDSATFQFKNSGAKKNLIDVYNFWSAERFPEVLDLYAKRGKAKPEEKEIRDLMIKRDLAGIEAARSDLLHYCFEDVRKTHQILPSMVPAWLDAMPSDASRYAAFYRGKTNYALNHNFSSWVQECESKYQLIIATIDNLILQLVDEHCKKFMTKIQASMSEKIELPPSCFTKQGELKKVWKSEIKQHQAFNPQIKAIIEEYESIYPGCWQIDPVSCLPAWRLKLGGSKSPLVQLFLEAQYLTGEGYKLVRYDKAIGFYVLMEDGTKKKITSPKKGEQTSDNCGSILGQDFAPYWESQVLRSSNPIAIEILTHSIQISYWISVRKRVFEILAATL